MTVRATITRFCVKLQRVSAERRKNDGNPSAKQMRPFANSLVSSPANGAVAYLDEEGAAKYAQEKGLFTIEALGASEIAIITNPKEFVPKVF